MANILLVESWDHYSTADIGKKWTVANNGTISAGTGRNGTSSMRLSGSQPGPQFTVANLATVYAGFAFKMSATGAAALLRLYDGGGIQLDLALNASNLFTVMRGASTAVATATTGALAANTYYYIEARFTLHASAGTCEVRVNGATVINATGLNLITTANAYTNSVQLLSGGGFAAYDFDDVVITTDAFLGDVRVIAVFPAAPGNYSQWTPSAGLGWQCVDEASMNSDTDYVSSSTPGQRNSYDFAAVGATGAVKAVQHVATMRKDDAGTRTVKQFARISGTDYDGSVVSVGDTYAMSRRVMAVNPATGTDWTVAQIDGSEFGSKLES